MLEAQVIMLLINLLVTCNVNKKLNRIETEFYYGTYPSDSFPDDPRHKKPNWYDICK